MRYLSIEMRCEDCEAEVALLVDAEERNTPIPCTICKEGTLIRVWSVPNVSTKATSNTIPDAVAKGRFDNLRSQHELRKEVGNAKRAYANNPTSSNRDELKRLRKEKKDHDRKA